MRMSNGSMHNFRVEAATMHQEPAQRCQKKPFSVFHDVLMLQGRSHACPLLKLRRPCKQPAALKGQRSGGFENGSFPCDCTRRMCASCVCVCLRIMCLCVFAHHVCVCVSVCAPCVRRISRSMSKIRIGHSVGMFVDTSYLHISLQT